MTTLMTTVDHRSPWLTTDDHRRAQIITDEYKWPQSTNDDHKWPPLSMIWPLMTIDGHRWPQTTVYNAYDVIVFCFLWAKCKRQFSVPFLSCSCSRVDHVCIFLYSWFEQINDDDDDDVGRLIKHDARSDLHQWTSTETLQSNPMHQ